jgi:hypothetical protein
LTTYMLDESNQYAMLTKIFVESSTEGWPMMMTAQPSVAR